jgi:hypothetical protein
MRPSDTSACRVRRAEQSARTVRRKAAVDPLAYSESGASQGEFAGEFNAQRNGQRREICKITIPPTRQPCSRVTHHRCAKYCWWGSCSDSCRSDVGTDSCESETHCRQCSQLSAQCSLGVLSAHSVTVQFAAVCFPRTVSSAGSLQLHDRPSYILRRQADRIREFRALTNSDSEIQFQNLCDTDS